MLVAEATAQGTISRAPGETRMLTESAVSVRWVSISTTTGPLMDTKSPRALMLTELSRLHLLRVVSGQVVTSLRRGEGGSALSI